MAKFTDGIERLNCLLGRLAAWCVLALILLQFAVVLVVYVFRADQIGLSGLSLDMVEVQELLLYLNAFVFLGGVGAVLAEDGHVRVDIFYRPASRRQKAETDLTGTLVFLLPFCLLIWWAGLPYALSSWAILESSIDAGGLPFIYILKSFILLFAFSLSLQGLVLLIRNGLLLRAGGGA